MWPFSSKKSIIDCGVLSGATDWHCHLLPGVDDGIQTLEETLKTLAEYQHAGIQRVWFTPHIMEDVPNTPEQLRQRFDEVCHAYSGPIELHLAAEHMIDNLFEERVAENRLLPIGEDATHILVETSYASEPINLFETLEDLMRRGYYPLLAHPERYIYMDEKYYERLISMGIRLQLNLFSLTGAYGPEARRRAQYLLGKGAYVVFGTDTHRRHAFIRMADIKCLTPKITSQIPKENL